MQQYRNTLTLIQKTHLEAEQNYKTRTLHIAENASYYIGCKCLFLICTLNQIDYNDAMKVLD